MDFTEKKRAKRRAQRERKVAKTKQWLKDHAFYKITQRSDDEVEMDAKKLCDNPKYCRHLECRNRRELEGLTRQERKSLASAEAKLQVWREEISEDFSED